MVCRDKYDPLGKSQNEESLQQKELACSLENIPEEVATEIQCSLRFLLIVPPSKQFYYPARFAALLNM